MIPWPLAALSVLYGLLAFLSAVRLVGCVAQGAWVAVVWTAAWLGLTAASAVGLPSQREWARRCAVLTALLFMVAALVGATFLVLQRPPQPTAALGETLLAGVALVIARYLSRPFVKAQFQRAKS